MALYDTNKNLIAGSRKTNIYRCNSFAEYEALPAAEKAKYDYVATPEDEVQNKADKVTNATLGHLASLDANGNLVDSGIAKNPLSRIGTDAGGQFTTPIKAAFQESVNSAGTYSLFSGSTQNDREAGWYGFKHGDSTHVAAIMLSRDVIVAVVNNGSGWTWTYLN